MQLERLMGDKYSSLVAQIIKNLPAMQVDLGLIPWSGKSPGEGDSNPLQYFYLENSINRGAWQATVHGVAESQTRLSVSHVHFSTLYEILKK